jgi:hypothetical protein
MDLDICQFHRFKEASPDLCPAVFWTAFCWPAVFILAFIIFLESACFFVLIFFSSLPFPLGLSLVGNISFYYIFPNVHAFVCSVKVGHLLECGYGICYDRQKYGINILSCVSRCNCNEVEILVTLF